MAEPSAQPPQLNDGDALIKRFAGEKDDYSAARDEANMEAIRARAAELMKQDGNSFNDPTNPVHVATTLFQASMDRLNRISTDPKISLTDAASLCVASVAASSTAVQALHAASTAEGANPATGMMIGFALIPLIMSAGMLEDMPNVAQSPERQRIMDQAKRVLDTLSPTPEVSRQEMLQQVNAGQLGGADQFNRMAQQAFSFPGFAEKIDLASLQAGLGDDSSVGDPAREAGQPSRKTGGPKSSLA